MWWGINYLAWNQQAYYKLYCMICCYCFFLSCNGFSQWNTFSCCFLRFFSIVSLVWSPLSKLNHRRTAAQHSPITGQVLLSLTLFALHGVPLIVWCVSGYKARVELTNTVRATLCCMTKQQAEDLFNFNTSSDDNDRVKNEALTSTLRPYLLTVKYKIITQSAYALWRVLTAACRGDDKPFIFHIRILAATNHRNISMVYSGS